MFLNHRDAVLAHPALQAHADDLDSAILISIFVLFVAAHWRAPSEEPHLVGPALLIGGLPTARRRVVVGAMLVYSPR